MGMEVGRAPHHAGRGKCEWSANRHAGQGHRECEGGRRPGPRDRGTEEAPAYGAATAARGEGEKVDQGDVTRHRGGEGAKSMGLDPEIHRKVQGSAGTNCHLRQDRFPGTRRGGGESDGGRGTEGHKVPDRSRESKRLSQLSERYLQTGRMLVIVIIFKVLSIITLETLALLSLTNMYFLIFSSSANFSP